MATTPNILFIVMDTARAKTVYNDPEVMPNFYRIAEDGTLFTNAFSTAPWTLPSHASMFSGRYTSDHGTHAGSTSFDPDYPPLAQLLNRSGYRTAAFSSNTWVAPEFGFQRGFEHFSTWLKIVNGGVDLEAIAKEKNGLVEQGVAVGKSLFRRDAHRTILNALYAKFFKERYDSGARLKNWKIRRWLSSYGSDDRPFFIFANYLEPHLEYDPPEKFRPRFLPEHLDQSDFDGLNQNAWEYICDQVQMDNSDFELLEALYKAELNYLDYRLGNLYDYLDTSGLLEETMIVIAGDHGENIGDHGLMDHQYCLYDSLLHVPLLVRYPDKFPAGKRFDGLVEVRDLFPTLLEVADASTDDEAASSRSLQQALERGGREYVHGEYATPQPSIEALEQRVGQVPADVKEYDRSLRSVRSDEWKLIEGLDGTIELYNIDSDPSEQNDVSNDYLDTVDELSQLLRNRFSEFSDIPRESVQMNSSTKDRLEDLGYL
ncbi:Arylsulfatase A [Natronoarchaeum philippinense]|uniref:Arylsulfatase A n=1 Tax=Natronoarchaeum philippinense TaxID=558529 RepID=A0A285P2K9_NATPI|nr:sulfatase [Natronoarchaeum philippinense]SNZ15393.1 Arylsulfatase A [Natronoarchaeum philippinense]